MLDGMSVQGGKYVEKRMERRMKLRKRLLAVVMSVVMVLDLAPMAFADTDSGAASGSITINGTTAGKSYDLYKIFDLTQSGDNGDNVLYTIDTDWTAFFTGSGAGTGYLSDTDNGKHNAVTVNGAEKYINITESNVSSFAEAALSYAASKTADKTVTSTGEDATASGLGLGYYLVYPRDAGGIKENYGSICSLTSTTPNATVQIKADYPTIKKTVEDEDDNVKIGQEVTYTITGKVPNTTGYSSYIYKIEDTLSSGLTLNKDVVVKIAGAVVSVTPDYDTISNGFSVAIDVESQQTNVGKDIVVTYTATVNKDAVVGSAGNENKAKLTYSNNPSDSTSTVTNPPVEVKVYTAKLVIDKVDGKNTNTKLAGAKFVLKNSAGEYYKYENDVVSWVGSQDDATVCTTDTNGAASFNGLENDTYELVEIKAPAGYNKLANSVSVTIDYADDTANAGYSIEVKNYSGTTLPTTGDRGTTMFYVIGGIVLVSAIVIIASRRRMRAED